MTQRIDKDSMPLNQPKRTPNHPTKSHIVKTKVDGKEKIIRFGEQGASTAGKPKDGESERMSAKRDSFKARHAANIAKGPSSAAYWANKVKWADGGLAQVKAIQGYAEGGEVDTGAAFGFNPNESRRGARARKLASERDVNSLPDPKTYAAIASFLGEAPDELGFSVMHPKYKEIREVAGPAFALGTATQMIPALAALKKVTAPARLVGGYSGAMPMTEFQRNAARFAAEVPEGRKALYHVSRGEWKGKNPNPDTWFSDELPVSDSPFGDTVRAYTIPVDTQMSAPVARGGNFWGEKLPGVKEPIAVINDSGVTSYVVRDPSILSRYELSKDLSSPSGLDRQRGAIGDLNVIEMAIAAARDRVSKLNSMKVSDSSRLADQNDYPTRFYRGMGPMVKGDTNSPKDFDELTKEYLSSQQPLSSITSLAGQNRPAISLSNQNNMPRNTAWAASNPLTGASYATLPNSVMVPLELTQKPGLILDAEGLPWYKYFPQGGRISQSGKYTLDSDIKEAMRDPDIKSILIKNIYDSGIGSAEDLSRLYGIDIKKQDLLSNNLLIKDPSAVRYAISGETPVLKETKLKKAAGGYVEYDPDHVDTLMSRTQNGFADGGQVNVDTNPYDETKIDGMVASLHEEMNNGY